VIHATFRAACRLFAHASEQLNRRLVATGREHVRHGAAPAILLTPVAFDAGRQPTTEA
jgi:hypothetical protein